MDFVLRDAYMSGYSTQAFDLDRLLHYTRFTPRGLTIHERGLSALVRFISVRAELFRAIYFHRTVRAIDLELQELFLDGKSLPVSRRSPGTSRSLSATDRMVAVGGGFALARQRRSASCAPWARRWQAFLGRRLRWKMACERTVFFAPGEPERSSVLSQRRYVRGGRSGRIAAVAAGSAVDGGHGPTRSSARHARPGCRTKLLVRFGHRHHSLAGRSRTVPTDRH